MYEYISENVYILNICIYNINYINIYMKILSKYIQNVCVFIYIHNKYTQYTHILCKQKRLFWMQLIVINHLAALANIIFLISIFLVNYLPKMTICFSLI